MSQSIVCDDSVAKVRAMDDDASSVSSLDYAPQPQPGKYWVPPPGPPGVPGPPIHPLWRPNRPKIETLRVNGKVPDVLHVIEYIGKHHCVVEARQSTTPFSRIPPWNEVMDAYEMPRPASKTKNDQESDGEEEEELPVIELVSHVYSRPAQPRPARHRRRGPPNGYRPRPITASFNNPGPGGEPEYYSSEEEDVDPVPRTDPPEPLMIINSQHLVNALRAVIAYYPYFRLNTKTVSVTSPYRVLYHHREELARYRDAQPEGHSPEYAAKTAEHIDLLLKFLDENNGAAIRKEEERHKLASPTATYELFWLLLKPGSVIFAKRYDIWTPFVVSAVRGGQAAAASRASEHYTVDCWMLESDGSKINRYMHSFTVAPWLGEQAIASLPVIPSAFWVDDFAAQGGLPMREHQIQLGRLYWNLLKRPTYMEYDGMLVNSGPAARRASGPTGFMSGRVICDVSGFSKYYGRSQGIAYMPYHEPGPREHVPVPPPMDHLPKSLPRCYCAVCIEDRPEPGTPAAQATATEYARFEDLNPEVDEPPASDLFYFVLSNTLPGFILGSRRWGHLNVANLKPVVTNQDAFRYLVLDDEVKMTVRALISKFANNALDGGAAVSPWGQDIVRNKGEGRIFLLHGRPGVGKTCTAECIAELTNRPLISLTSGDLGMDAFRVEEGLSYFLELGQRYGALVLLDEADVYLERRRSKDISRNGLVSVFLRALEYYKGVLFLTTNRVQSFDSAFLSRIHVALHYKNLRDEDRERIWANNFDRLDCDTVSFSDDGTEARTPVHVSVAARDYVRNSREVRALAWNGREIRNAMQTALALAESDAQDSASEAVVIGEKHIRAVVKMSKGFRDYIKASSTAFRDPRNLGNTFDSDEDYEQHDDHEYHSDTNDNGLF